MPHVVNRNLFPFAFKKKKKVLCKCVIQTMAVNTKQ